MGHDFLSGKILNVLLSTQVLSFTLMFSRIPLDIYALIEHSDSENIKGMKNVIEFQLQN